MSYLTHLPVGVTYVVMVLVDFFVDGSDDFFVFSFGDGLMVDGRGDLLMDCGVVVAILDPEITM